MVVASVTLLSVGLEAFGQVPAPTCSAQEVAEISARAERATLEKVRQDLRVEGRMESSALGVNDQDCLERARHGARNLESRAIEKCERDAVYFRTCEIVSARVSQAPRPLQPVTGWATIDDYKTDEARCRADAENRAQAEALAGCQRSFNRTCRITSVAPADHRVDRRRRYGLIGPKEDFHICNSTAQALPNTAEQVQCAMEVIARVRIL